MFPIIATSQSQSHPFEMKVQYSIDSGLVKSAQTCLPYITCILFLSGIFLLICGTYNAKIIYSDEDDEKEMTEYLVVNPNECNLSVTSKNQIKIPDKSNETPPVLSGHIHRSNTEVDRPLKSMHSYSDDDIKHYYSESDSSFSVTVPALHHSHSLRYTSVSERYGTPEINRVLSSSPASTDTYCGIRRKSLNSVITSSSLEESRSYVSLTDIPSSDHPLIRTSISNPSILLNWRISVPFYGIGVITKVIRKRFRTTLFRVRFDDGSERELALKRSQRKGNVPFQPVNKMC
eukprot:gene7095-14440_t